MHMDDKICFHPFLDIHPCKFKKTKLNSDVHMDEISRFICLLRRVRRGRVGVVGVGERDARERERERRERGFAVLAVIRIAVTTLCLIPRHCSALLDLRSS